MQEEVEEKPTTTTTTKKKKEFQRRKTKATTKTKTKYEIEQQKRARVVDLNLDWGDKVYRGNATEYAGVKVTSKLVWPIPMHALAQLNPELGSVLNLSPPTEEEKAEADKFLSVLKKVPTDDEDFVLREFDQVGEEGEVEVTGSTKTRAKKTEATKKSEKATRRWKEKFRLKRGTRSFLRLCRTRTYLRRFYLKRENTTQVVQGPNRPGGNSQSRCYFWSLESFSKTLRKKWKSGFDLHQNNRKEASMLFESGRSDSTFCTG